ncbi:MAG TPA: diguanylate cyclase [Acidobacteriaceae bacterium]|nr:diguanylate cyclase [Acidobacteriaceae bacterium]
MPQRSSWFGRVIAATLLLCSASLGHGQVAAGSAPIVVQGLGKGTASLSGPWRFHLGDNPAWAAPGFDDSGWEKVTADLPWGQQGHDRYTGYAWYRCRLALTPAPGVSPQFSLLLEHVDDAYEIYWNGRLIGHNGKLDPYRIWYYYYSEKAQTFALGPGQSGVLAFRVWKAPLFSDDSGQGGGFESAPLIGSPEAIAAVRAALDYQWLSGRQFLFGQNLIYALIALVSFLVWLRHRSQWLLFWMMAFTAAPVIILLLLGSGLHWPYLFVIGAAQPFYSIQDEIALWFLLLWLLPLRESRRLCRLTRILAWVSFTTGLLDGAVLAISWGPRWIGPAQIVDGVSAAIYTLLDAYPLILIAAAFPLRRRFDSARRMLAALAFLYGMVAVVLDASKQGRQFTNWTLATKLEAPLFTLGGSAISLHTLAGAFLLVALVYAVTSRLREDQRHKEALEREKIELTRTRDEMRHFAENDDLTGLSNHRIIAERLTEEVERSRRQQAPLSVILADIDHFKNINDTFGHVVGDRVLKEVAAIFRQSVRPYDSVGRYGGEEFLIILPGSDFESASTRAEQLRRAVQSAHIMDGETQVRVTSSFGVASGFPGKDEAETVIRIADAALYEAKRNGRNRVVVTEVSSPEDAPLPAAGGSQTPA